MYAEAGSQSEPWPGLRGSSSWSPPPLIQHNTTRSGQHHLSNTKQQISEKEQNPIKVNQKNTYLTPEIPDLN